MKIKKFFYLLSFSLCIILATSGLFISALGEDTKEPLAALGAKEGPLNALFEKWLHPTQEDITATFPEDLAKKSLPVEVLLRIGFTHVANQYPAMTLEDYNTILDPNLSLEEEDGKVIFRFSSFLTQGHFHLILDASTGQLIFAEYDDGANING